MSVADPVRPTDLRRSTARGSLINAAFLIGVTSLGAIQGFVVAGFLSRRDYGVWGLLTASLGSLALLKQVGIPDRYVAQAQADQELAFQQAFTLEVLLDTALALLMLAVVPILAFAYGRQQLLAPGFALVLVLPALALQFPLMIFYRRMDFRRQRSLGAIAPVVELVVSVGLAAAGAGYWSLIIGALAANYATALAVVAASPYRLAWRFDRASMRDYFSFSWPLLIASGCGLVVTQGAVIVGTATVGLAGVGGIALASSIASYTTQVDQIVSQALYPAVCAIRERSDLLLESFAKANRLGLLWGAPLGVGIALFAPDLVRFGIGAQWRPAIGVIQAFGAIAAIDQIAFNWDDYFRARSQTRPMAVVNLIATGVYVAVAMPLLAIHGLPGFEVGMLLTAVTGIAGRLYYVTRLFSGFDVARHVVRALAPTAPAAITVLALRALISGHGLAGAVGQLLVYLALVILATIALERALLAELLGYLRRPARA
jgi:lipopolysaccharide exporter